MVIDNSREIQNRLVDKLNEEQMQKLLDAFSYLVDEMPCICGMDDTIAHLRNMYIGYTDSRLSDSDSSEEKARTAILTFGLIDFFQEIKEIYNQVNAKSRSQIAQN